MHLIFPPAQSSAWRLSMHLVWYKRRQQDPRFRKKLNADSLRYVRSLVSNSLPLAGDTCSPGQVIQKKWNQNALAQYILLTGFFPGQIGDNVERGYRYSGPSAMDRRSVIVKNERKCRRLAREEDEGYYFAFDTNSGKCHVLTRSALTRRRKEEGWVSGPWFSGTPNPGVTESLSHAIFGKVPRTCLCNHPRMLRGRHLVHGEEAVSRLQRQLRRAVPAALLWPQRMPVLLLPGRPWGLPPEGGGEGTPEALPRFHGVRPEQLPSASPLPAWLAGLPRGQPVLPRSLFCRRTAHCRGGLGMVRFRPRLPPRLKDG